MALQIDKELEGTGLVLNYHKIEGIFLQNGSDFVTINIGIYASKEASQSKLRHVSLFLVEAPLNLFNVEGNLLDIAYSVLKSSPEYQGAIDV